MLGVLNQEGKFLSQVLGEERPQLKGVKVTDDCLQGSFVFSLFYSLIKGYNFSSEYLFTHNPQMLTFYVLSFTSEYLVILSNLFHNPRVSQKNLL